MSLEISGKVISLLPEQSGEGKNGRWVKQDFVIETEDQFPKKVCFSSWGDKVEEVKKLIAGEAVTISFNAESREYNGKWYTDLRAWKIIKSSNQQPNTEVDTPSFTENDIPPEQEDDDLPF
ncbi:MAG: DUF3127 domain-containing protein [Bacteroidales bacterium]|nr:DUF3127 domain-containing protein [Bacteroidales bacterium]